MHLVKQFGLAVTVPRIPLHNLEESRRSLPAEEDYAACARRGMDAALRLMACCSGQPSQTVAGLLKRYVGYSVKRAQAGLSEDPCDAGQQVSADGELYEDFFEDVEAIKNKGSSKDHRLSTVSKCYGLLSQMRARELADRFQFGDDAEGRIDDLPQTDDSLPNARELVHHPRHLRWMLLAGRNSARALEELLKGAENDETGEKVGGFWKTPVGLGTYLCYVHYVLPSLAQVTPSAGCNGKRSAQVLTLAAAL